MSSLTGTQINQTYPSLLKMETSTTGVTSTLQNLEDGLGNDTGIKIATNRFEGSNIVNIFRPTTPAKYYGQGMVSTPLTPTAGIQNMLCSNIFYDNGIHSYSGFTVGVTTLEAGTSVDISFYNAQYLENYGYVPYQKLVTEVNIPTTSTGFKIGTFATPLSFSGTGPGFYFMVVRFNTAGTPVLRMNNPPTQNSMTGLGWFTMSHLGIQFNTANTVATLPFQAFGTSAVLQGAVYNVASFPSTFTATELNNIASVLPAAPGFLLHTIR